MARVSGKYQYTVNIMPHLKLSSYSVGVSITETTNITSIDVKRLSFRKEMTGGGNVTEEAGGEEEEKEEEEEEGELAGAEILMSPTNPGKVTVNYQPDIRALELDLRREKHPLQLVVEYEVDRSQAEWRHRIGPDTSRYCALIGCHHGVATPALLCHKDTAQDTSCVFKA